MSNNPVEKSSYIEKNIILFCCENRTSHFGQGAFIENILPFFESDPNIFITIIKTDCSDLRDVSVEIVNGKNTINVPHLPGTPFLTGEDNLSQLASSKYIISKIYSLIYKKENMIFWANSVDFLNLFRDIKSIFTKSKLMYVHHSFSWKYYLNITDEAFEKEWKNANFELSPGAFQLTAYQKEMAIISDTVVVVTEHAKRFFVRVLGINGDKISVIYNGIPIPALQNKSSLRKKYGFKLNSQIVLFCGRITEDKGFPDLLKAFKIVADNNSNARSLVIGAGRALDKINYVKPHWNKITFTGEIKKEEVFELYQLADVGVLPSLHEQCSFTAIEMRLNKLPMIVSGVDGLDELFTDDVDCMKLNINLNKSGEKTLCETEFSNKINRLLQDKVHANKLAKNSFKNGIKYFTDEKMGAQYLELLNSLLNEVHLK